jgi:hypothetical protein
MGKLLFTLGYLLETEERRSSQLSTMFESGSKTTMEAWVVLLHIVQRRSTSMITSTFIPSALIVTRITSLRYTDYAFSTSSPNMTVWADTSYPWPKNRLLDGCA